MEILEILLNGERRRLAGPLTVSALLEDLELDARQVAVELNRRILKRSEFDDVEVQEGDALEVVHFVGGGAETRPRRPTPDAR